MPTLPPITLLPEMQLQLPGPPHPWWHDKAMGWSELAIKVPHFCGPVHVVLEGLRWADLFGSQMSSCTQSHVQGLDPACALIR